MSWAPVVAGATTAERVRLNQAARIDDLREQLDTANKLVRELRKERDRFERLWEGEKQRAERQYPDPDAIEGL